MLEPQAKFQSVNLADPRQDVHKERKHHPNLNRYKVAENLLPANASGLSVLELGGGTGELSRRMRNRGIEVTFADLSEHNIQKAKTLGLETHQLDLNLGLSPLEDERFDGVVMLEIIEHIVAAEYLLEEVNRILKPGGFVILSTPNFANFMNRIRILLGNLSHDEGYHYRFFTVKALSQRLANAGLIIDRSAHTTPALGVNFIQNKIFKYPRRHVKVADFVAPLFANTLIVRARKPERHA